MSALPVNYTEQIMQAKLEIAELRTRYEYQSMTMAELKLGQTSLLMQLREIQDTLVQAKGGWRVLMLLGGVGAAIGSLATYIVQNFQFRG
jgi:chromosome condensin MukBEF complex kleisin-like MukF subunit